MGALVSEIGLGIYYSINILQGTPPENYLGPCGTPLRYLLLGSLMKTKLTPGVVGLPTPSPRISPLLQL